MPELPKCKRCGGSGRLEARKDGEKMVQWCERCSGKGVRPATLDDLHAVMLEIKIRLDLIYESANG